MADLKISMGPRVTYMQMPLKSLERLLHKIGRSNFRSLNKYIHIINVSRVAKEYKKYFLKIHPGRI